MAKTWGMVLSISVKGHGANSAQLLFSIETDKNKKMAFVARFQPTNEPQVFSAMASLISAAYFAEREIGVEYVFQDGENQAIEVFVPES